MSELAPGVLEKFYGDHKAHSTAMREKFRSLLEAYRERRIALDDYDAIPLEANLGLHAMLDAEQVRDISLDKKVYARQELDGALVHYTNSLRSAELHYSVNEAEYYDAALTDAKSDKIELNIS